MLHLADGPPGRDRAGGLLRGGGHEILSELSLYPVPGTELPGGLPDGLALADENARLLRRDPPHPVRLSPGHRDLDYRRFYDGALRDLERAKQSRDYALDAENHPNWFDASFISWLSYDALHLELPDGYLYLLPIVNWGRYREENGRLMMPVTVRLNHASADGYQLALVFRLLETEIAAFVRQQTKDAES